MGAENDTVLKQMLAARVVMAPLSGISDIPFRLLVRRHGCRFAFTEMIDVNGLAYNNRKTKKLMDTVAEDAPLAVQIVGADEERILHGAMACREKGFRLVDLNAGCPVHKVVKAGKGAALLKDPEKLAGIVGMLVKNLDIPVTVKIRSGWDDGNVNCLEIARMLEGEGAAAVCIHPRTVSQLYKGKADHDLTRQIKEALKIPVFASGGMFSAGDVDEVFRSTGCDGVFIARGALWKPWIFNGLAETSGGVRETKELSFAEVKAVAREHMELVLEFYDPQRAFSRMHKHMCWYFRRWKDLNEVMDAYRKVKSFEDFLKFLDGLELEREKYMRVR